MKSIRKYVNKLFRVIVKSVMIILLIHYLFFIWWGIVYGRGVYKLGDTDYVTVWKRAGGDCYIMPYKYYGLILPKKNFFVADNLGGLDIVKEDSTLLICDACSEKDKKIKGIYLPDYKYEYIDYYPHFDEVPKSERFDTLMSYDRKIIKRITNLPHLDIDIRHFSVSHYPVGDYNGD